MCKRSAMEPPVTRQATPLAPGMAWQAPFALRDDGCYFDKLLYGSFICDLANGLDAVEVKVAKEWLGDLEQLESEVGQLIATAYYTCYDVLESPDGTPGMIGGSLYFEGEEDTDIISVYPYWDGKPFCMVTEDPMMSAVEADVSDCVKVEIAPGIDGECTITNTVFFEGIPTLSRRGIVLLTLLMLGVGLIGSKAPRVISSPNQRGMVSTASPSNFAA